MPRYLTLLEPSRAEARRGHADRIHIVVVKAANKTLGQVSEHYFRCSASTG